MSLLRIFASMEGIAIRTFGLKGRQNVAVALGDENSLTLLNECAGDASGG
jgi:hypothetical protein